MLRTKDFLYFYRILNWKNKISGIRPIGYTIFGYLMAGNFYFFPIFLNAIAVFLVLIFCYGINDYFDWKFQKEENFLSFKLKHKKIKETEALIYYFLPLFFLIPILYFIPKHSLIIFLIGFFLIFLYSAPPLRFKKIKFFGFILPPLAVSLLFLEGYSILGFFYRDIFLLTFLIFLFQCYLEAFHVLDDFYNEKETKKIKKLKFIEGIIKITPIFSAVFSLLFIFFNPFFLISFIASLIRFFSIKEKNLSNEIFRIRRKIFSFEWFLYEFLIYGILGILKLF